MKAFDSTFWSVHWFTKWFVKESEETISSPQFLFNYFIDGESDTSNFEQLKTFWK